MSITATEFKKNLSKYLSMAETEDIYITKYGHMVAKLCNPNPDRVQMASSLFGVAPDIRDYTKSSIPAVLPGELLERISEKRNEKEGGEEA